MGRTEKVGRGERDMSGDESRGTKGDERMEGGSQMSMGMRGNQERSESGGGGGRESSGGGGGVVVWGSNWSPRSFDRR